MLLGARQFFERRGAPTPPLPYDAEVEYLESTGTQWIDTGVVGSSELIIDISWSYSSQTSDSAVFGSRVSASNRAIALTGYYGQIDNRLYLNYSNSSGYITFNDFNVYGHDWRLHLENGNTILVCDGVTKRSSAVVKPQFTTPSTLPLFGLRNKDQLFPSSGVRIKTFIISSNGVFVRDLISVRFTNEQGVSEGAMYDRVSGALFRNAGTGAFTIGPDK